MSNLLANVRALYREAGAFSRAYPLLFLIPVLVEAAQHFVELRNGMYVNQAGALAAETDVLRLQFGYVKTLALMLPGYWFTRFIMFGRDDGRAARIEWPAFPLWLGLFAVQAAYAWFALFGTPLSELIGIPENARTATAVALALFQQAMMILFSAWFVAWPLGQVTIGPLRSIAIMRGSFWYALALVIAGIVPLMVVHYALAIAAVVVLPEWLDWMAMALDSLVVGYLALIMVGAMALAARHAARRRGVTLGLAEPVSSETIVTPQATE